MTGQRVPDHSLQAEEAVLGTCLAAPHLLGIIGWLLPEHFFDRSHGLIYEAMKGLEASGGGSPDAVTLAAWLQARGKLDLVRAKNAVGIPALAALLESFATYDNVEHYARIVFESWQVRQLEAELLAVASECRGAVGDRRELLNRAEKRITTVTGAATQQGTGVLFKDAVRTRYQEILNRAEAMAAGIHITSGQSTGFTQIDDWTGGLSKSDMWILAARPGFGKTSLALNIAVNVAYGVPHVLAEGEDEADAPVYDVPPAGVAFFSLEMPRDQIIDRALCAEARVNTQALKQMRMSPDDWSGLRNAVSLVRNIPLWIDDAKGLTVADIRGRTQRQKDAWERDGLPLGLIVIDYIQLIRAVEIKGEGRDREVARISKEVKAMAGQIGCPVLALAQLNRSSEKDQRRPRPGDIAESDQPARDADLMAFLCTDDKTPPGAVDFFIAKQRNGTLGPVPLIWRPEFTRFDNYTPEQAPYGAR